MKPFKALLLLLLVLTLGATAQENIFPFNASWKYLDDGSDQGTAWRNTAFNDTGWKSGPGKFGYGISDANTAIDTGPHSKKTHITTYFRKSISIADPAIFSSFTAHIKRDDGLVVYVNGVEVLRDNMPAGEVSYSTKASSASDNGTAIQTLTIPKTAFKAGTNLIAVEVHQQNGNNPDMAFDMALTASIASIDNTPPAIVSLNRLTPLSEVTSATSVTYRLSFSEGVSGVDRTDFVVTTLSGTVSGTLATNAVSAQGSDGSQYNITISAINGEGSLRLDLRSGNRGIADLAGNPLGEEGYTSGQVYTIEQQQQPAPPPSPTYGFASVTNLAGVAIAANTGEKPQSKPWTYDGKWWMVMPNSSGTYLWRLDGTSWTQQLRLSTKTNSKADCKVAGNLTHVFMFQGASSQIASLEYVPETGTYQMWSRRTSTTGLSLDTGVEIATIDIDGTGRMWLASDGSTSINVRWSDAPYNNWSAPIVLANNTSTDDICSIIALPGKIGVFWSNQATKRFGFKTHLDGASPTAWSADEVPASQSALNVGNGMADDHVNLAAASDGTLYCAVKTEFNSTSHPTIALLVRRPDGSWDNLYGITNGAGTRPIVILNEVLGKVKVIYTASDSGGDILYRESPMSGIAFGSILTLMKGAFNNATSTKANYGSEIVVLASSSKEAVGVLASDGAGVETPPGAPLLLSPPNSTTGINLSPTLSWQASNGASAYQAQVSTSSGFSSLVFNQSGINTTSVMVSDLAAGTLYYWRVRASNAAGISEWSSVWSFSTEAESSPPPPTTTSLVGHWKMDEGSGNTLLDASGLGNHAATVKSPGWVEGVQGLALQLNGTSQYARVTDHASLNITNAISLAGWIRPEKTATQYIIKKAMNSQADGYELSLSNSREVFFRLNQTSAANTYRINSTIPYPIDGASWMHIAATFDGSVMRLYINGVENTMRELNSSLPIGVNTLPLILGADADGKSRFQGALDDVRIYHGALSAAEVSALMSGAGTARQSTAAATMQTADKPMALIQPEALQAYPNPFRSGATIHFSLAEEGEYILALWDMKGSQVAILQQGRAAAGEQHTLQLDALGLGSGLYLLRLQTHLGFKTLRLMHE